MYLKKRLVTKIKKCYNKIMGTYNIKTIKEKKRIIEYCQKHGKRAAAQKFDVAYVSLLRWLSRVKKGGAPLEELLARKPKRHTVKEEAVALVRKLHAQDPSLSLAELKRRVSHIQDISRTTIWHAITGR